MAELTITLANVDPVENSALLITGTAGETITAGQSVYKKAADGLIWLADANASTATAAAVGIAVNGALAGHSVTYQVGGDMDLGATLTAGVVYVVGATTGSIAPITDVASGWTVTVLGIATAADNFRMHLWSTGITR